MQGRDGQREKYIRKVCDKTGLDKETVAAEMDYAYEHGISYWTYCYKGYWFIPHDKLVHAHYHGARRRRIARELAKIRGRRPIEIEREIIYARYKLGLRVGFFRKYDWDLLTEEQREQMLLRPYSAQMSRKYRTKDANPNFLNKKHRFYKAFPEYIGRKWMRYDPQMTAEEFAKAIADFKTSDIIYKPEDSSGGSGIRKFSLAGGPEKLYGKLKEENCDPALLEECLEQHPDMARLCDESINTIRAVCLYWEGEYHLLYTVCRMGAGKGKPVDNVSQGGLAIGVDPETGRFNTVAADHDGNPQTVHPASGVELPGYQVPYWDEVLELVKMAAIRTYELAGLGYTGWDIAITPDGPVIVEGNNWPSPSLIQLCNWLDSRKGMKYLFEPYL